jgi:hypothetical protein
LRELSEFAANRRLGPAVATKIASQQSATGCQAKNRGRT